VNINGRIIQGNIFRIGASCGVVIEVNCPNQKEAERMRDFLERVLEAWLDANGFKVSAHTGYSDIEGENIEEILRQIARELISDE